MNFQQSHTYMLEQARRYLPTHLDRLSWSRTQILSHQLKALRALLRYAKQNCRYYQNPLAGINCDTFQLTGLNTLPIITKQDTLNHWNDFIPNQTLTYQQAESHLQKLRDGEINNPFYKNHYLLFATGGSSGQRGLFAWNRDTFAQFINLAFRHQIRDEQMSGQPCKKMAALVAPSWLHASVPLFTANIDASMQVRHVPADLPMDQIVATLEDFQPDQLIGYSSIIIELSHLCNAGQCQIKPKRVSTNSEPIDQDGRDSIHQAWQIQVNNSWGAVEAGMLGIEDDQHVGMWLSEDCSILEPVDQDLQPVNKPEDVRRLLMTNLINTQFPLIRYVIDDAVVIETIAGQSCRLAKDIQGRSDDWFIYDNHIKIHPMAFRHVLGQHADIIEYQVIQTLKGADIRIVSNIKLETKQIADHLQHELQQAGLNQAELKVVQQEALDRHVETGKLKRFIPLR